MTAHTSASSFGKGLAILHTLRPETLGQTANLLFNRQNNGSASGIDDLGAGEFPCQLFYWPKRTSLGAGMMVDRSGTLAEPGVGANGLVDKAFGARHGGGQRQSMGEAGGDGRGVSAAGAVGMRRGHPRRRELVPLVSVEEEVRGIALEVSALEEHGARAQFQEAAGGAAHVVQREDLHAEIGRAS